MALAGLDKNRKFLRLAQRLNAVSGGMGEIMARGVLETLWSAAYERADDFIGDAEDVEMVCRWRGEPGALLRALLTAGGEDAAGFIEETPEAPGFYKIHDLWDHAPPYVKKKAEGKRKREAEGRSISDLRREAGRARHLQKAADSANGQQTDSAAQQTDSKSPPDAGKTSPRAGLGRVGLGGVVHTQAGAEPANGSHLQPDPRLTPDRKQLDNALYVATGQPCGPKLAETFERLGEAKARLDPATDATAWAVACVEGFKRYREGCQRQPGWNTEAVEKHATEVQLIAAGGAAPRFAEPPQPQRAAPPSDNRPRPPKYIPGEAPPDASHLSRLPPAPPGAKA